MQVLEERNLSKEEIYATDTQDFLYELYQESILLENSQFVTIQANKHTMGDKIHTYVKQKLPIIEIKKILSKNNTIEIHGIYPDHFDKFLPKIGFSLIKDITINYNLRYKKYNYIRPKFYIARTSENINKLIVLIPPGKDYLLHYANLLRFYLSTENIFPDNLIKAFWYRNADEKLSKWIGLHDCNLIKKGDKVVIGYVHEFSNYLESKFGVCKIRESENAYITVIRYSKNIVFLGVKFSFWGDMSARICASLCKLGVNEIIYAGKLGCLTRPEDMYQKIFSPNKYLVLFKNEVKEQILNLKNGIAENCDEVYSGLHASVPTVLEESIFQRDTLNKLGVNTIDNEISQIACSIALHNCEHNDNIYFSPIHFATDYLRNPEEIAMLTPCDLSNNRTNFASHKKDAILEKVFFILSKYLKLINHT